MDHRQLERAVPDGEALRYSGSLRRGGLVGLTDDRLLVVDGASEPTSVALGDVDEVEFQDVDWYLALLSLLLVAFGLVSTTRNLPLGVAFALAGVGSLVVTYRKRDRTTVRVHSRPKPLELYPEDVSAFHDAFEAALDRYRERQDAVDRADG